LPIKRAKVIGNSDTGNFPVEVNKLMSPTILLAEKNRDILEILETTLSHAGFNVVATASKSSDVEDLAFETKPKILIYDLHLSENGKKGLKGLKHIKELFPGMKIFLLSFHESTRQLEKEILDAGFNGIWSKFDSRDELIKKLKALFH
jgi:DNA-binding NarL/FixJ family response regulator